MLAFEVAYLFLTSQPLVNLTSQNQEVLLVQIAAKVLLFS